MKQLLNRSWNYVVLLLKGVMAARRWLLAYFIFILIPASILLYTYSQKSSQILEEEVTRTMLQTLKQASINLDYQFNSVRDTSNIIFMHPKLNEYLSTKASLGQQYDSLKELRYLVDNAGENPNVFRVRLFVNSDRMFSNEKVNFFSLDDLKPRSWYPQVVDAGGSMIWAGAYLESYIGVDDPTYVLSGARILRDPDSYDEISGVLLIDIAEKTIQDILSKIELTKEANLYLAAPDGTLITHRNKALIGTNINSMEIVNAFEQGNEAIVPLIKNKNPQYAIISSISSTGWRLVAEVPKAEITSRATALNQFSSVATLSSVTILFLLLVFILLAVIVRGMNRRMQMVIKTIKREGIEGLEDRNHTSDGDFNFLENSVNHLIHKVRDLMEETYQTKVQEREAQLRALQAQINPHFLYNTLDTINWIAIGRNAHDISQMIDGLAKYFRLSLNKGRDLVSVSDELNLAKVYLEIQQTRFPKSFEFHFDVEDGLEPYEMPKLTLQPIVENALLHGIRRSKGKRGVIWIRARKEEDELVLSVEDDGIGMEQAIAEHLLMEPRPTMKSDGSGSSYGLYNVNERIKLFAGEAYGLQIQSKSGEGTTVTVRFKCESL
jgi:two-component system sensor histidine kinase YesM